MDTLWTNPNNMEEGAAEKFLDQILATATICRQLLIK